MITKSFKLDDVDAALKSLPINKTYSIQEIVDTIKQITNFQSGTEDSFKFTESGSYDNDGGSSFALSDLYVDMSYQRRIRLRKILEKLATIDGYDKNVAGWVDVAYRPCQDMYFVWDGLRRCIMVGLCGGEYINASLFKHPSKLFEEECRQKEAFYFKVRNAEKENMTKEEIFKAEVVYGDETALALLALLKKCDLDVEGLNPQGTQLGGFKAFQDIHGRIPKDTIINASKLYKEAWNKEPQVLGYGLCGLAYLLNIKDDEDNLVLDNYYTNAEIRQHLRDYALLSNKPKSICNPRLNSKPFPSIAANITKNVLKDNNGLLDLLLTDVERETLGMG